MKKIYTPPALLIVFLLSLPACLNTSKAPEYKATPEGLFIKLLTIGDGFQHPEPGQILRLQVKYKTQNDSVFWDSENNSRNGYFLNYKSNQPCGNYTDYLSEMVEGDSVSFLVKKAVFFKQVFEEEIPVFTEKDSVVKVNLKLVRILKPEEYKKLEEDELIRLNELKKQEEAWINHSLQQQFKHPVLVDSLFYYEILQQGTGNHIDSGKKVSLAYKGYFMDGRLADYSPEDSPFEFYCGEKEQLVPGLQIGITLLKEGDLAKFILPSQLAFGELGSSTGNIPPYTPMLYEVKILKVSEAKYK